MSDDKTKARPKAARKTLKWWPRISAAVAVLAVTAAVMWQFGRASAGRRWQGRVAELERGVKAIGQYDRIVTGLERLGASNLMLCLQGAGQWYVVRIEGTNARLSVADIELWPAERPGGLQLRRAD